MDLMQLMEDRFSCRRFTPHQLTDSELDTILRAGRLAPSAINRQPWRFLVLQGEEALADADACTQCRYGAPTAILICFDADASAKNPEVTPDYGWIDCGLAMMQMALEAQHLGLASCIVGAYDPAAARRVFNMPENIVPYQFLMLGHADIEPAKLHSERLPLEDIVIRGSF